MDIRLPAKGKKVIALCADGIEREVFRCACKDDRCTAFRCAITGYQIMIDVIKWRYADD